MHGLWLTQPCCFMAEEPPSPTKKNVTMQNDVAGAPQSADPPVVICAPRKSLLLSESPAESQYPSEKRRGSSHWGLGDVDL